MFFSLLSLQFHFLYFISFALIILGVIVYSIRPPPVVTPGGSQYREMRTASPQTDTPQSGCQTEITYHTTRTNNGTAEACSVQISKYIPNAAGDDQKQLMLHQEEDKRPTETEEV